MRDIVHNISNGANFNPTNLGEALNQPLPLIAPEELAEYLGQSVQKIALMRINGTGPKFIRTGRVIRYRMSDVEAWLDQNTHESTDEYTDQFGTYNAKPKAKAKAAA